MANPADIPAAVREALAPVATPRPMRRGSLSERYMRCNKPGCPCSQRPEARHGPYFSLTRAVAGSTRSRLLSPAHAQRVREQIEAGQQFRKQVDHYWQACEQWADAQLEVSEANSTGVAKKGGSRRPSTRKSSPRSKRS